VPLTPADGAVFDASARKMVVTLMQPVPGALGYQVQVAIADGTCFGASSTTHEIEFEALSMGSYTWRVWAIFPDGLRSAASEWRNVTYLK